MGVSLSFIWELVNTVQVFEFMSLLQVDFPPFVVSTMGKLTISSVDYLPIRDWIEKTITTSSLKKPWKANFAESNYSTLSYLYNASDFVFFFLLILIVFPFLFFARVICCCKKEFWKSLTG